VASDQLRVAHIIRMPDLLLLLQETLDRKPSPKNSVPRTGDNAILHIFKHPRFPSLNKQTALQVASKLKYDAEQGKALEVDKLDVYTSSNHDIHQCSQLQSRCSGTRKESQCGKRLLVMVTHAVTAAVDAKKREDERSVRSSQRHYFMQT